MPEIAEMFALDGYFARNRPTICVLPQLTTAEITHVFSEGLPPCTELPSDLRDTAAFPDYWNLVHGYNLPVAQKGYARVVFRAGSMLTYPLACLWRRPWIVQPMMSVTAAPDIIKRASMSFEQLGLLGGQEYLTISDTFTLERKISVLPSLLPTSRAVRVSTLATNSQDASSENDASTYMMCDSGPRKESRLHPLLPLRSCSAISAGSSSVAQGAIQGPPLTEQSTLLPQTVNPGVSFEGRPSKRLRF